MTWPRVRGGGVPYTGGSSSPFSSSPSSSFPSSSWPPGCGEEEFTCSGGSPSCLRASQRWPDHGASHPAGQVRRRAAVRRRGGRGGLHLPRLPVPLWRRHLLGGVEEVAPPRTPPPPQPPTSPPPPPHTPPPPPAPISTSHLPAPDTSPGAIGGLTVKTAGMSRAVGGAGGEVHLLLLSLLPSSSSSSASSLPPPPPPLLPQSTPAPAETSVSRSSRGATV